MIRRIKHPWTLRVLAAINNWFILRLPFVLPLWMLSVHKDHIGRNTWTEWFPNWRWFGLSFAYKLGKKYNQSYIRFLWWDRRMQGLSRRANGTHG